MKQATPYFTFNINQPLTPFLCTYHPVCGTKTKKLFEYDDGPSIRNTLQMTDKQKQTALGIAQKWLKKTEKTEQKQIYLGLAQKWRKKTQKNQDREYLDSKTGTYRMREYRPRSPQTPKLREYKPKFREVELREYVPKTHVTSNQYVTLREYDHTYEVEPPDDDDDRPMGEPRFCKPYRAIGSIKRTLATLFPPVR